MPRYDQLDAFKACEQLTLAVHRTVEQIQERDSELAGELWLAALIASSRIARGVGFGNRRMFATALDRSLGALSEIGYHLNLARVMDLVSQETHAQLEALRGRATFYTTKLLFSLQVDPGTGSEPPSPGPLGL